jgi:hypothetical protein
MSGLLFLNFKYAITYNVRDAHKSSPDSERLNYFK